MFFTRHSRVIGLVLTGASLLAGTGELGATFALAQAGAANAATHADLTRAAGISALVLTTGVGFLWHSAESKVGELTAQQPERGVDR